MIVSARIDEELAAWLDQYAEDRAATRGSVVEAALRAFRELAEGGVPDLVASTGEIVHYK